MTRVAKITILTIITLLVMAPAAFAQTIDTDQRTLLKMINAKRQEKGVKALKWGFRIQRAAERHSEDMATKAYMAHTSPSGATLARRLKDSGISRWSGATENITSAGNARAAYNKWLGSSTTRAKMLDSKYTHVGIGITDGGAKGQVFTLNLVANPKLKNSMSVDGRTILNLLNAERAKVGAPALKWGYKLAATGRLHSKDMLTNQYFSHTSEDGSRLSDRLRKSSVSGWTRAGENIAGTSSADRAFGLWMESGSHRKNMLDPSYTNVGVGYAADGSFKMFTMNLVAYPR